MVDFKNQITAFKDKSNIDLTRAYFLFSTISNPTISKFLTKLLQLAIKLKLPINYLVKITIFKHFCGGETIKDSTKLVDKLWASKIGSILDYSAEGKEDENDFKNVYEQALKVLELSKENKKIPFIVFKLTGLIPFSLLEKLSQNENLNTEEELIYNSFLHRLKKICKKALEVKTPIFIDAEESWIQNAIDNIVFDLMKQYNKENVIVFNTLQMYRKDRINYLKSIINKARNNKFKIGLKIVRGAYHEKEIERAKSKKYEIPVHLKKIDTDNDFNLSLKICIENIDLLSLCSGTHNVQSTEYLLELMKSYNIKNNDNRIFSSQLLGMSDNISYNLALNNYNVAKYVPYGPIKDVIPYLIRRAEENRSISGQMNRELKNIIDEKRRRQSLS